MPRFYFQIRDGFGFAPDEEGQELPSIEEARAVAVEGARSLLGAGVEEGRLDIRGSILMKDNQDQLLETVRFEDVVEVMKGPLPPLSSEKGEK